MSHDQNYGCSDDDGDRVQYLPKDTVLSFFSMLMMKQLVEKIHCPLDIVRAQLLKKSILCQKP